MYIHMYLSLWNKLTELIKKIYLHNTSIVLFSDLIPCPSMFEAVQYIILPLSSVFPLYTSLLEDISLPSEQSVAHMSDWFEAVVMLTLARYHCIFEDGLPAFVLQVNSWLWSLIIFTGFSSVGVFDIVTEEIGTTKYWTKRYDYNL